MAKFLSEPNSRATVDALMNLYFNALREKFAQAPAGGLTRAEGAAVYTYFQDGRPELDSYYRALFLPRAVRYLRPHQGAVDDEQHEHRRVQPPAGGELRGLSGRLRRAEDGKPPPDRVPREVLSALFHTNPAGTRQRVHGSLGQDLSRYSPDSRTARRFGVLVGYLFCTDPKIVPVQQCVVARFVIYFREDFKAEKKWIVKALNYNAGGPIKGSIASSFPAQRGAVKILLMAMICRGDAGVMNVEAGAVLARTIGDERIKTVERVKMDVKLLDDKQPFWGRPAGTA